MTVRPLAAAPLVLLVTACGFDAPASTQPVRVDSGGVEIVSNQEPDYAAEFNFRRHSVFGGTSDDTPIQLWPHSVATSDSLVYLLDIPSRRIAIFNHQGQHLTSFGRSGDGPGEMSAPATASLRPSGEVAVYDFRKRGIIVYSPEGEVVGFEPVGQRYAGGRIRYAARGLYLPTRESGSSGTVLNLLRLTESDSASVASLSVPGLHGVDYEGCNLSISVGPLFSPHLVWDASGSHAAVAAADKYAVSIYEHGVKTREIRRAIPAQPVTEDMAFAEVGDGEEWKWSTGQCRVPAAVVVKQRGYVDYLQPIAAVSIAPDSSVWVKRTTIRGEPTVIDVFSADGAYVGTLPPESPWPVAFLDRSKIVAIERDELDVDRLVVYTVTRN